MCVVVVEVVSSNVDSPSADPSSSSSLPTPDDIRLPRLYRDLLWQGKFPREEKEGQNLPSREKKRERKSGKWVGEEEEEDEKKGRKKGGFRKEEEAEMSYFLLLLLGFLFRSWPRFPRRLPPLFLLRSDEQDQITLASNLRPYFE